MTVEAVSFSNIPTTVGERAAGRDLLDALALPALVRRSDLRGGVQSGKHLACTAATG